MNKRQAKKQNQKRKGEFLFRFSEIHYQKFKEALERGIRFPTFGECFARIMAEDIFVKAKFPKTTEALERWDRLKYWRKRGLAECLKSAGG